MRTRWFICDFRYLPISITLETEDAAQTEHIYAWIFDAPVRPIATLHIDSVWAIFHRCVNFVILCTDYRTSTYQSDIYDTDDTRIYPLGNPTPSISSLLNCLEFAAVDLLYRIRRLGHRINTLISDTTPSLSRWISPPGNPAGA